MNEKKKNQPKMLYPCHDNSHFHVERLLDKQLIIAWLVKERRQPRLIPNPANEAKKKREHDQ